MEQLYVNKLSDLEIDYERRQKKIEKELEEAFFKKQQFGRELENLSENFRYHYLQAQYSEPINMSRVYHLLEQCKSDGDRVVAQKMRTLEETQEENSSYYRKQYQAIEDELAILKEQEREKAHE